MPDGWEPREYQKPLIRYLQAGGKRADVVAHRRWGKDEVALHWTATQIARKPGTYWHLLPEASQGRKAIWDAVNPHTARKRIDEAFPKAFRTKTVDAEMKIEFRNGSVWQVVGSDNYDRLVGSSVRGVVFSEWALAKPDSWTYIRPILVESDGWNTGAATTAREYILPGGGRIVAGRVIGPNLLIWTSHALFLGSFVGSVTQPWRFDRVGEKCGLIGPNAAVVVGQQAYWLGPDLQFYRYGLGGAVEPLPCSIREAQADNLAASQGDKIVASSSSSFSEIRFDYPDAREGSENSRYLLMSLMDGAWSRGIMARTAMIDAGPSQYPIGVDPAGGAYWHERGQSADGGAFSWFVESADQCLDENATAMVRGLWPDMADQVGPVSVSVIGRFTPQGNETSNGAYSMAPGADRVDLRTTGRMFRVRFAGGSAPTACRIGRPVFDIAPAGSR